jgi:sigma-B regulation protein RsbU (phosphoserine phosphatase)
MRVDIESSVREVPLFAGLHSVEIGFLASLLHEVEFPAGALLFQEGDPGDCFCIILEGEAEVTKALGTPDELLLAVRRAGEFFGEMSLLEPDGCRTASVRARTPLRLLKMSRTDFDQLMHHRPAIACEMTRVLSLRLNESHISTIAELREKNRELAQAYEELKAAQAEIIEKKSLERELETARWIQQSILPHTLPRIPGFDLGAFLMPARAVGGDLFDFIPLGSQRVGVVIGDVSDKGVPAAIFMALTYSLLRAEAVRWSSPARVLQATNHHLLAMNEAGMFVTVLYGVLDCRRRSFLYARAGHELPLHFDPQGNVVACERGAGQPLGLFDAPDMEERSITLEPGAIVLMYTDGAIDLTDAQGKRFGRERLWAAAHSSRSGSAQALCDRVWATLSECCGTRDQADDIALVAIQAVE